MPILLRAVVKAYSVFGLEKSGFTSSASNLVTAHYGRRSSASPLNLKLVKLYTLSINTYMPMKCRGLRLLECQIECWVPVLLPGAGSLSVFIVTLAIIPFRASPIAGMIRN